MATRTEMAGSSEPLLARARATAERHAGALKKPGVAGIVFLGAIAKGYFDAHADIDIAVFTEDDGVDVDARQLRHVDGFAVHHHVARYEGELRADWDMAKRWAYAESIIHWDPDGLVRDLLARKVTLQPAERTWLAVSGLTLSEWYINRLTRLWVDRGSVASAHGMFSEGLNHFYGMLFGVNNELVADHKWRHHRAERLARLPSRFRESMNEVMVVSALTEPELVRRRDAFMAMWEEMRPVVETMAGMSYEDFKDTV